MIFTIPSVLTPAQVAVIRERLGRHSLTDGAATAHGFAAEVKSNLQLDPQQTEDALELSREVAACLLGHAEFQQAAMPVRLSTPMFNLYRQGMYYGPHADSALLATPEGPLRGDMSMTVFLSRPDEYSGGELHIRDPNSGTHHIKLAAGAAICYPSYAVHEVLPVTGGERWACVLWIQSAIRNPYQRTVLWQLQQVSQLAQSGQTPAALVELAQARNNLLRLWAQT